MQLSISGHHVELTESLNEYIRHKFEKIDRHYDHITQVHVVLNVEKFEHLAEATAHVTGGELFANANAEDMYASIDALVDKLDRQLIKHKEKTVARHNGSHQRSAHHD
ncbi:MAG: ribosome-associated translation inhibitor RaiA [Pseudomonadales bacterium]|nr:ribosome-associated translation inhibitor RaiA [Pseudomonadales bacterium]